ncbi:DUF2493 domain-containing protein [Candidatus Bathyarchaeota archaeon]|nr:MAG: DUF2493 domain-containing protein [Candidatus Bathyarchaeota archaeon]
MKVIVAGGREFNNYPMLVGWLDSYLMHLNKEDLTIISGMARGADSLAVRYANERGIKVIRMPANWDLYAKRAGYIRNAEMAKIADMLIVFWDGQSRGTANMIKIMDGMGKKCNIVRY